MTKEYFLYFWFYRLKQLSISNYEKQIDLSISCYRCVSGYFVWRAEKS